VTKNLATHLHRERYPGKDARGERERIFVRGHLKQQTEFREIWSEDMEEPRDKSNVKKSAEKLTSSTNPGYDGHELSPSRWITERLMMTMRLDVILKSNI
jgi:hypothetical protein